MERITAKYKVIGEINPKNLLKIGDIVELHFDGSDYTGDTVRWWDEHSRAAYPGEGGYIVCPPPGVSYPDLDGYIAWIKSVLQELPN